MDVKPYFGKELRAEDFDNRERKRFAVAAYTSRIRFPNVVIRSRADTEGHVVDVVTRFLRSKQLILKDEKLETVRESTVQEMGHIQIPRSCWYQILDAVIPYRWKRLRRLVRYTEIATVVMVHQDIERREITRLMRICPHIAIPEGVQHFEWLQAVEDDPALQAQRKTYFTLCPKCGYWIPDYEKLKELRVEDDV